MVPKMFRKTDQQLEAGIDLNSKCNKCNSRRSNDTGFPVTQTVGIRQEDPQYL